MSLEKSIFFERINDQGDALTFSDVTMETGISDVGELEIDLTTKFTRNVDLKLPFVSAAMDTVTDGNMAIAMAKLGCIGVIHAAFSLEQQKDEVQKVKFGPSMVIRTPWTAGTEDSLQAIEGRLREKDKPFRSIPILATDGRVAGLLTQNHFDLAKHRSDLVLARDVMVPFDELTFGSPDTTVEEAYELMQKSGKKAIPLINDDGTPAGLYIWSNIDAYLSGDRALYNVDDQGRLVVAVAVPTGDKGLERIEALKKYADAFVIDSSTGGKKYARGTLKEAKQITDVDIMIGNVVDPDSIREFIEIGADGAKVGQSPGSICTTESQLGYGKPQLTAVYECAVAARGSGMPICADGGASEYGHLSKAIAAGADSIMMGRMLAGVEESAAPVMPFEGEKRKYLRGMGSSAAMSESDAAQDRYDALGKKNPLPQGEESVIPIEGPLAAKIDEMEQALRGSMSGIGRANLREHQLFTRFVRKTLSGAAELRPHDIQIIRTVSK